jgi:hypothetical protein
MRNIIVMLVPVTRTLYARSAASHTMESALGESPFGENKIVKIMRERPKME